jgi:hypothetical protein
VIGENVRNDIYLAQDNIELLFKLLKTLFRNSDPKFAWHLQLLLAVLHEEGAGQVVVLVKALRISTVSSKKGSNVLHVISK